MSGLAIINSCLILSGWVYLWYFLKINRLKHARTKDFKKSVAQDVAMNAKLSELRFHMDADKAKIFQFHNGGLFFNGHSIKKMSLTHLQLRADTAPPHISDLQMLPTSLFPNMMSRFLANKGVIVWDARNAPDIFIRTRALNENLKTVMLCGIYHSETSALVGFIALNWLNEKSFEIDEPALIEFAKELGKILGRET